MVVMVSSISSSRSREGFRRPSDREDILYRDRGQLGLPLGSATVRRALTPNRKEDRPTMDVSRDELKMTAGLDLGDKYSYLCLIDTLSGEVIEEGRLRTTPETFRRRFASQEQP